LVFIEVKTRTSSQFGTPFEAITHWKMQALVRTSQFYKATHRNLPEEMRIDAISVTLDEIHEVNTIEQIENISGF
jgi:putative endonuclease